MKLRGHLSAIEDEWHIRGIPEWIDPVFTFQRTWASADSQFRRDRAESEHFNATLAKVFAVVGAGLLGYYVWEKTHHKVYTGLAGAAGFFGAPILVAAYDRYQQPEAIDAPDGQHDETESEQPTNTYTETGTQTTPTLVPASPDVKSILTAARQLPASPAIRTAVMTYKQDPLI